MKNDDAKISIYGIADSGDITIEEEPCAGSGIVDLTSHWVPRPKVKSFQEFADENFGMLYEKAFIKYIDTVLVPYVLALKDDE